MLRIVNRKLLKSTQLVDILARFTTANMNGDHKLRGALIVMEGCDRSGKTTQCGLLQQGLTDAGHKVKLMKFPDRTTIIGHMINDYLTCKKDVNDQVIHLLFSANRWENVDEMLRQLDNGTTLIVDRYVFSGVAFSAAKPDIDMTWCKGPDIGLPKPDAVLYLTLSAEAAAKRGGYGEERYEQSEFQKRVAKNFEKLKDKDWMVIDADKSVDDLHRELMHMCKEVMAESASKPLHKLWTDGTCDLGDTDVER